MKNYFLSFYVLFLLLTPFYTVHHAAEAAESTNGLDEEKEYQAGDPELDVQWISEKNGDYIPLARTFQDETGKTVSLGDIIDLPTLILPIYFYCPNSCSVNLINLVDAVKRSKFIPGKDFHVIALSFNDKEDDKNAQVARKNYLGRLPKDFPQQSWTFLTGSKENISALTDAVGYSFKQQKDGTFIHPSALVAVSGDGRIIKYVYGSFISGDIDMAISEAQSGTPAMSVRRFLGYCFNYAPEKSRSFFKKIKISVLLGCAIAGALFFFYLKRGKKKRALSKNEHQRTGNKNDGN